MKKIITFVSKFNHQFSVSAPAEAYECDSGITVYGKQSNEAPLLYLLSSDSEIGQIICLVTPEVLDIHEEAKVSPYQYLQDSIKAQFPNVDFLPVDFEKELFYEKALPEIISHIQPEDSIYLDTTGGFRDTVSQLMLLSRILQYQNTPLLKAVYSQYRPNRVTDVTDSYRTFDLINGLNEFERFCSTDALLNYYDKRENVPFELTELIQRMKSLSECITLCRVGLMTKRIKAFQQALEAAKTVNDPILRVTLPMFEAKFRMLSTTPEQIKWCVENNLIQQAFTLFTDRLPKYLIQEAELLILPRDYFQSVEDEYIRRNQGRGRRTLAELDIDNVKMFNSKEQYNFALNDGFFKLSYKEMRIPKGEDAARKTMNRLSSLVPRYGFQFAVERRLMVPILNDYLYISVLRNQFNHVNEELTPQQDRADYLKGLGYQVEMDKLTLDGVKRVLLDAVEHIQTAEAAKK